MRKALTAVALALAIAVSLGVAASANATFAGTNGKIAFVRAGDIWTMNGDGTNRTQLTTGGGAGSPSWRPDGQKLAYIRAATYDDNGSLVDPGGIEFLNANGTGTQRLLEDASIFPDGLTWSPDCSRLAFGQSNDQSEHIWTVNAVSGIQTELTTGTTLDRSPDWSPDGSKIAFTSTRQAGDNAQGSTNHVLYVMKSDGTGVTRLTNLADPNGSVHERDPSWKPDGTAIVIRSDTDFGEFAPPGPLVVVSANGSTRTVLETTDGPLIGANPVWSPDGTKIASGTKRFFADIAIYDVGTQTVTTLSSADTPTSGDTEPDWVASNGSCAGASDKVPPTLSLPTTVVVDAVRPGGANVPFTVTAKDDVDPAPSVTCAPPSLSLFAIGDTTVSCTAKDAAGNTATGTFTVHVRGAVEQLRRLSAKILADPGIAVPVRKILAGQIQAFANLLARGVLPDRAVCRGVDVLLLEVGAVPQFAISTASRASVVLDLLRIRAVLGC